jgi:hypothetical protein
MMTTAPALLTAFADFCEKATEEFSDFELVRNPEQKLKNLLNNQGLVEHFQVIGRHGTGSLIAFWRDDKNIDFARSPIVWLSSEGFPNSVLANSFADFLSILPYDTGLIWDVLSNYYNHKESPDLQSSPEEKFTPDEIASYLTAAKKRYNGHSQLVDWLNDEARIEIASDPLSIVKWAIVSHIDLASWLRER